MTIHFPVLPIIGGTPAEEELKELVAFAKKKENWFDPEVMSIEEINRRTDIKPKNAKNASNARHIKVGEETYHIVFTITKATLLSKKSSDKNKEILCRHVTIGVGDFSRIADISEAFTILSFLGFNFQRITTTPYPYESALVFIEPLSSKEEKELMKENQ